ncbi:MAG: sulfatase, partial [Bacteroidota bacterium]
IGYKTIHIGKWHLGEKEEYWPEFHGFDRNIGGWKMGMPKKENNIGGYFSPYFNPRLPDGSDDEYLTERLTEESLQFIQDSNEPFFLNFWLYNVHTPLQARKEKIAKYDTLVRREKLQSNAVYAAMIEHMDAALGSVVDKLKETGKYENTIFIFGSDNGGFLGVRGDQEKKPRITSNHPLRSGKGDIYDGGVRVPFIVSWPTLIGGNRESDVLTISTDILPTILGLMGGKSLIPASVDGIDLSSYLLEDQIPKREALYWHYPHYHTEGAEPFSAIREGNWKLIHTYEKNELELYNLAEDLGEQINLIEKYPQKGNELEIKLKRWKKIVHAQDPTINENFDSLRQHLWQKSLIVW